MSRRRRCRGVKRERTHTLGLRGGRGEKGLSTKHQMVVPEGKGGGRREEGGGSVRESGS
jgi:hypothetical protein